LQALNFYASELKIRGILHADVAELNPDYPRGTIIFDDPTIAANGRNYFLDSIYVVSAPSADSGNNILIEGRAVHAKLWGHTPLTKIGDVIQYQVDRHYALDSTGKNGLAYRKRYNLPAQYDLNLIAKVENNPVIQGFVPDLKSFDTIRVEGAITNDRLFLNADAPQITYMNYQITDAKVRVNGTDSALTYVASVDHLKQNAMDIWFANAAGNVKYNTITSDISISDPDSVKKFGLSASMQKQGNDQIIQLYEGLMLNYKTWQVNEPNQIVFSPKGFYVQNFGISNGPESILVNSQSASYNAPLTADITNFMLSNITNIISKDTLLANGVLAGNINLQRFSPDPQVSSVLGITNLSIMGDTIGNVDLNVRSASSNVVDAQVGITGYGNNITMNGMYYPTAVNGNNFNMRLMLDPMNVAAFEGATMNQIKNTSGYIRGDLKVNGTLTAPLLYGSLRTDSLSTNVSMLNTQFRMPSEEIRFNGQSVQFNDFGILDSGGNRARLNGNILVRSFSDMDMNMRFQATNWQAMSSTAKENKDFYGRLFLTTNMTVKGPLTAPGVDGSLNILEGTSVTVTIPAAESGIQERDGIVEFVDITNPDRYKPLTTATTDTVRKLARFAPGSEINLNVSSDEEAEFSVIIDEGTGDFVRIRGKADLNTTVAPDGTLGLVGTYEIKDGTYHFNYNFIRRQFRIQPGSRITFSGDPNDGELDVTAIYEANVPPYDLVARQVPDPTTLVFFKQRLPFEVQMKLTGPMMQPDIAFDIALPDDKNYRVSGDVQDLVRARLSQLKQDPSEMNKQVFALIILNRFVTENVFESGVEGGGVSNIARQSVSRFIGEQLNQFASGLIEGIDLTVDLTTAEDFTTGERRNRTDLTVGASKRLLNDRLTINVGNNFQLEGPKTTGTQGTSFIPGNLAVDYDLTTDRTYRLRFFRRNQDMGVFQGYVVETGASFIVQRDYNRLRQLFMTRKKRERLRKEREERRQQRNQEDSLRTTQTAIILPKDESDAN
ncbi:MAG: translocation/assembly module TamB, partial [Sphingobacteriales bacterium]